MGFLIAIIIIALIISASGQSSQSSSFGGPHISTNEIVYPADIHCDNCNEKIDVTPFNIDGDSWDLKCPHCKKVGYKHPKSEERKQQIQDMLDW